MRTLFCMMAVACTVLLANIPKASASEWGCEVLLCASSSNPSWHGVASCHPPMEKLISAMAGWNFTWPACPEAGTGPPGYEKYEPCKTGYAAVYTGNTDHISGTPEGNSCEKIVNVCETQPWLARDGGCNQVVDSYARPVRDKPYYFDLKSTATGAMSRHYFDLNE
jgi:hypothetical protein